MTLSDLPRLQAFKQELAENEIENVLDELMIFLESSSPYHLDEVIQHSGRYESLAKSQRLGTISFENASIEINQIRNGILAFITQLEKTIRKKRENTIFNPQPVLKNSPVSSETGHGSQSNVNSEAKMLNDEGLRCLDVSDWTGALDFFNRALEADPTYGAAYSNRGLVKVDLGDFEGAARDYDSAIAHFPTLARAWNNRSVLKLEVLNDLRGAFDDINQAISLDDKDATTFINRGNAFLQLEEFSKAIHDFTAAIDLSPGWHEPYLNRGITYQRMDEYNMSIPDFNKAILIQPDVPLPYHHRGLSFYQLKRYREAITDFTRSLEIDPVTPWGYSLRGLCYFFLGDYQTALEDHKRAIEVDPQEALNYTNCGSCRNLLGFFDEALQNYLTAIKLDPSSPTNFLGLATSHHNLGQYEAGIEAASKAIELNPDYYTALQLRGIMYYNEGNYHESIRDLEKVMNGPEADEDTCLFEALCYYKLNMLNEALVYTKKSLEKLPSYGVCWYWQGVFQHDLNLSADAKVSYQKAILYAPELWTPYNNLGIIFLDEEQFDQAISLFEKAVAADPNASLAQENLKIAQDRKKNSGGLWGLFK